MSQRSCSDLWSLSGRGKKNKKKREIFKVLKELSLVGKCEPHSLLCTSFKNACDRCKTIAFKDGGMNYWY